MYHVILQCTRSPAGNPNAYISMFYALFVLELLGKNLLPEIHPFLLLRSESLARILK